jgi:hypothetical protein
MLFDISDLVLWFIDKNGAQTPLSPYDENLRYFLTNGTNHVNVPLNAAGVPISSSLNLATLLTPQLSGLVEIRIEYTVPDDYPDTDIAGETLDPVYFYFRVGIQEASYFWVARNSEFTDAQPSMNSNVANNGRMIVFILLSHVDLRSVQISANNQTIIIIAAEPGIILGREAGGGQFTIDAGTNPTFYFGAWSFPDELIVALPVTSYPFTVHGGGTYQNALDGTSPRGDRMIAGPGAAGAPVPSIGPEVTLYGGYALR